MIRSSFARRAFGSAVVSVLALGLDVVGYFK